MNNVEMTDVFTCVSIETKIKKQEEEVPVSGQEGIIHVIVNILKRFYL